MPVTTGKITWRNSTANKSFSALLTALKNFIVNSGNYTLVTDQISASNYFVIKSVRNTGFAGDSIVAQISANSAAGNFANPFLTIQAWESWSGLTGTNYGVVRSGYGSSITQHNIPDHTQFSLSLDTDIWISCDTTFILSMSRVYDSNVNSSYSTPNGVVNIERLSGDSDTGAFYGHFGLEQFNNSYKVYIPKRWDGATGDNAWLNINTKLGQHTTYVGSGLHTPDESGNHVVFDIGAHYYNTGRVKGKLYGVNISTYGLDLSHGMLLPDSSSPQYIVGKPVSYMPYMSILMQTSTTITSIAT